MKNPKTPKINHLSSPASIAKTEDKQVAQLEIDKQDASNKKQQNPKSTKSKKLGLSIGIFVIGMITLIVGVVFLVLDLIRVPDLEDGEFLISADRWVLSDGTNCADSTTDATTKVEETENEVTEINESNCMSSVIWNFTEIGKGTLTTNGHLNDYDFIWAISDGKLQIETKWLYDLENTYEYELDQREKTLTLIDGEKQIVFIGEFTDKQ